MKKLIIACRIWSNIESEAGEWYITDDYANHLTLWYKDIIDIYGDIDKVRRILSKNYPGYDLEIVETSIELPD